jgi:hypothetical protein
MQRLLAAAVSAKRVVELRARHGLAIAASVTVSAAFRNALWRAVGSYSTHQRVVDSIGTIRVSRARCRAEAGRRALVDRATLALAFGAVEAEGAELALQVRPAFLLFPAAGDYGDDDSTDKQR